MSHRKGVYVGEVPVYEIEARQAASSGSYYLLTTSYGISGNSSIHCDLLQHDTQTLNAQYALHTNFPPSAVRFAPRAVSTGPNLVLTTGEAIGVWDQGLLTGFCVPEALKSVGLPLAGRESAHQPVWGVTAAQWSDQRPAAIVAAHRSGSLGLYHVDRLPGARQAARSTEVKAGGFFDRFAKLFSTPVATPARAATTPEAKTGCQIFAHLSTTPNRRLSPGPAAKSTNPFYCTDIDTLDSNLVIAAHNADSSLSLFDTREKPQVSTHTGTHTGTHTDIHTCTHTSMFSHLCLAAMEPSRCGGRQPKVCERFGGQHNDGKRFCVRVWLATLFVSWQTVDKIRGEMHIYDMRTASQNTMKALETFGEKEIDIRSVFAEIKDMLGHPVLVNDALVLRSSEVVLALQKDECGGRGNDAQATRPEGVLSVSPARALTKISPSLQKCDLSTLREGSFASKTCMGNVLTDDNCAMAVAADDSFLFWVELGMYVPGSEEDYWRVSETPYSGEPLRNSTWLEASGTWIHMLPLR